MKAAIKRLLFEAYRRLQMQDSCEQAKPLLKKWVGLGTEAAYRPALNEGLFRFHDDRKPYKRCMGWLCLTEKGAALLQENEAEFKRLLEGMKASGYDNSIIANYTLAGGITR